MGYPESNITLPCPLIANEQQTKNRGLHFERSNLTYCPMNESSVSRKRFAHGLADINLPTMVVRVNEVFEAAQAYHLTADAGAVHVGVAVLQHLPRILERLDDGGLVGAVCFEEQCYWMHRYDYGSAGTLEVLDGNGGQAVAIYSRVSLSVLSWAKTLRG